MSGRAGRWISAAKRIDRLLVVDPSGLRLAGFYLVALACPVFAAALDVGDGRGMERPHAGLSCNPLSDCRLRTGVLDASGPEDTKLAATADCVCVLYLGSQMLLQAVTGYNLFGDPRFGDGTLTGPYDKPRVSAPFALLGLPTALFLGATFSQRSHRKWQKTATFELVLLPFLVLLVLAGQRMALATFLLGTAVCAAFLPVLRRPAIGVALVCPVLIGLLAFVSPQAFGHLVLRTETQLGHFAASPYGQIYNRAAVMTEAHPALGLGDDAFRHYCGDPAFFVPGPLNVQPDGGRGTVCVQHAHNHVLEAASNSGLPGAALFMAMIAAWWRTLAGSARGGRFASASDQAWRVGLLGAAVLHEWPVASQSAFLNMPLGGVAFLLLGAGFAEVVRDRRAHPPGV